MNNINLLLKYFKNQTDILNLKQQEDLEFILKMLLEICKLEASSNNGGNLTLGDLRKYIKQKMFSTKPPNSSSKINQNLLRNLRNELVHGKSLSRYNNGELKEIQMQFWETLEKISERWQFDDLKSFLSYCIPHQGESTAKTHSGIVRYYSKIFFSLPQELRTSVFSELVMRIFSEAQFKNDF